MGTVVRLQRREPHAGTVGRNDAIAGCGADIVILPCVRYERPQARAQRSGALSPSQRCDEVGPHTAPIREPKAV